MKIKDITDSYIEFDNGNKITFDHDQDCCEVNYADFLAIKDDVFIDHEFDENLEFEEVDDAGFRFGNENAMIFVPCYSEQNGYYTTVVDIYYNGVAVANVYGEEILY